MLRKIYLIAALALISTLAFAQTGTLKGVIVRCNEGRSFLLLILLLKKTEIKQEVQLLILMETIPLNQLNREIIPLKLLLLVMVRLKLLELLFLLIKSHFRCKIARRNCNWRSKNYCV